MHAHFAADGAGTTGADAAVIAGGTITTDAGADSAGVTG